MANIDATPAIADAQGRIDANLVGRAAELSLFRRSLSETSSGTPCVLLIGGEAGVGKTRLVNEWRAVAYAEGASVLTGSCVPLGEAASAYAPLVEVIRGLLRTRGPEEVRDLLGPGHGAVARLLPELDPAQSLQPVSGWGHGQLFEAVLALLGRIGGAAGVVLVVEDVHWADRSSLDLLGFLIRNIHSVPAALIVATFRAPLEPTAYVRTWASELSRLPSISQLALEPLGRADVASLLRQRGIPDPVLADKIYRRSSGNPFFALELLAAGATDGDEFLPATLSEAVLSHTGQLPAPTQRLLQLVSVAGGKLTHRLLAAVWNGPEDLLEALRNAVNAGVLERDGEDYKFHHAIFGEATYAELLPAERSSLHRRFAAALEEHPDLVTGTAAGQLGAHWIGAGEPYRALPAFIAAAKDATAQFALPEAHQHWEQLLALWPLCSESASQVIGWLDANLSAADAAMLAGDDARALELADAAMDVARDSDDRYLLSHILERRAHYHQRLGHHEAALGDYRSAAELPASRERSLALLGEARVLSLTASFDDAKQACERALADAVDVGNLPAEGYARHAFAKLLALEGAANEAFAEIVRASELLADAGDVPELGTTFLDMATVAIDAFRVSEAVDHMLNRTRLARELGLERTYGALIACIAAGCLLELGRWNEADGITATVDSEAPTGLNRLALDLCRGTLLSRRGQFEQGSELLHSAQAIAIGVRDAGINGLLYSALADSSRWQGDLDLARFNVRRGLDSITADGDADMIVRLCVTGMRIEADRAEWARRAGADDELVQILSVVSELEERVGTLERADRSGRRVFLHAAALNAHVEADRARANVKPEDWDEVIDVWDRIGYLFWSSRSRYGRAEALANGGYRDEAAAELTRVHQLAEAMGCKPMYAQAEVLARRAKVPFATSVGPRAPSRKSAGALTDREVQVLELVASGRTNRQIASALYISEKTAGVHVSRIITKLGASNRSEAAAIARRRGLLP